MKKIFTIIGSVLLIATVWAQSPQKMSYQAVVRNSNDALVTNTQIGMQISILQGSASGTVVYTETQTPTTNANGLVSIEIGGGAAFDAIDWSAGPYFIKTETDPAGGTSYSITGTSQLLSVPYALHAKTAETVTGGITETQNLADVISINNSANRQIKDVTDPTDAQDAATKAYVDELEAKVSLLEDAFVDANIHPSKFKDNRDGNIYDYVTIGDQVWMAENLAYLPSVVGPGTGSSTTAYHYVYGYNGTDVNAAKATANYTTYGVLYNWTAAMDGEASSTTNSSGIQGVCPTGWHLPSDAEWTELIDYLGGRNVAGGKLKETGDTHWKSSSNIRATNETGFTALPGGYRFSEGTFGYLASYGYWWSATENNAAVAWSRSFYFGSFSALRDIYYKEVGLSVRCVRD